MHKNLSTFLYRERGRGREGREGREALIAGTSWLFEKPGTPVSAGTLAQADDGGGSRAREALFCCYST
jgi:hypothetical protein